ncbi:serine/arginine repetitive matrix protein 1-like [Saccostrea cucullata]|uniref:serine/arginine repetitive matrix protein 1-like n=1 Tax=Saccostrea cuccullata TaxID=36930 RepID=UPI002ED3DFBC
MPPFNYNEGKKTDDQDSSGTRGSRLLVPDKGLVSSGPQKQVAPEPRQTCDNPDGTTPGGSNSPDQAVPKKRRWRPYNRVWRRDQKWTREGLTYPQKPPVSQKSAEPGEVSSETRSPPTLVSDKVVPNKKKRHWTYNRVWQKDKKWIREEQTQQQAVPPPTPVHRDHPTKTPPVPVPKQHEPPPFLKKYWRRNRVWRRDMVWVRKPTPEPETHAVDEAQDPTLVPSSQETVSSSTDSKGQETVTAGSSSATDVPLDDGAPSPPAASDVPPLPPSDELKTITVRLTDGIQSEDQTDGDSRGGASQKTSDLRSPSPCCTEKKQTGVENQSTRKRKRPSGTCVPSKRQKTALFSPMEIEMQSLEQMFAAWTL